MRIGQGAKVKEEKNIAPIAKDLTHKREKVLTYQEWVDSLLANPTLKTVYEKETAKRKK